MEYGASAEDVARVCHAHPVSDVCPVESMLSLVPRLDLVRVIEGSQSCCLLRQGNQLLLSTVLAPLKTALSLSSLC